MTAPLEVGEWSASRFGRTLPSGKTRYLLYRTLCGLEDRSGRAANLIPHLDSIPDRPARNSVTIPTELPACLYIKEKKTVTEFHIEVEEFIVIFSD